MSRPRLFYVLDSLEENEVGDQVATLLGRLSRSRYEPRVVALGPRGSLGSRLREMKITVHRLELSGPLGALLAVPRLRRLLGGLRAEILHTFQPWSGAVAQLAAPRGARVFRWVQGFPTTPATLEGRLQAWLERRAAIGRNRRFVVSDPGARACVMQRYRVNGVEVIPECLDLGRIRERVRRIGVHEARVRLGVETDQRSVLCFSDFQDRARMSAILEGFAMARVENPRVRLFVQGRGPEEGAARWQAENLRLEDSLVFLAPSSDRAAALRAAEAVVDAGAWPGWSRGAVEAMALGLPVLRWVEEDDDDAVRYPVRTAGPADRFARDLLDVLEDDGVKGRMAGQSAAEAQAFDVATVADRWAELYGA